MNSASAIFDFDETMAELENMLGEMQRNLSSANHRQVLGRYLEGFKAPPDVGPSIERAMASAAPAAEELRLLLASAETEDGSGKTGPLDAGLAKLRRALKPVAQAVRAARPEE